MYNVTSPPTLVPLSSLLVLHGRLICHRVVSLGIGCAGEIRIREDEDFEQWAIEIYVKFRDHEKLQLLTGQRQSGGVSFLSVNLLASVGKTNLRFSLSFLQERSLTTILYLMSLTEEARAPFSLVDEINQVRLSHIHFLSETSSRSLNPCFFSSVGYGPTCRARGAQLNGRSHMQRG